jgi:DNA-binding NarL/FixJ family response regulator
MALERGDTAAATAGMSAVVASEVWDPVVIAIRGVPAIGGFIAEVDRWRGWLQRLLSGSSDTSLARKIGIQVPRGARAHAILTPREHEVHELLAKGLTNEQIANALYISLSTTKVHVKHIYEKLGVRSRVEAARALSDDV